jgi:hypothetical protein
MERLLMLELACGGCAVEVHLNGMPLAALGPRAAASASRSTSTRSPAATSSRWSSVPPRRAWSRRVSRASRSVPPGRERGWSWFARASRRRSDARVLGVAEWSTTEGRSYDAPSAHKREVDLPVNFPRWRWLDAPPIELGAPVKRVLLEFLQQLAVELGAAIRSR